MIEIIHTKVFAKAHLKKASESESWRPLLFLFLSFFLLFIVIDQILLIVIDSFYFTVLSHSGIILTKFGSLSLRKAEGVGRDSRHS